MDLGAETGVYLNPCNLNLWISVINWNTSSKLIKHFSSKINNVTFIKTTGDQE